MPSIIINEVDATRTGSTLSATDIVYVPGFVSNTRSDWMIDGKLTKSAPAFTPILCKTVAEFEQYFGRYPLKFTYDITMGELGLDSDLEISGSDVFISAGEADPSYIYAKELLNLGIPVLYESFNDSQSGDPSVADFVDWLAGAYDPTKTTSTSVYLPSPYEVLKDRGEYEVKYITSGGYPNFETGCVDASTSETKNYTPTAMSDVTIDNDNLYAFLIDEDYCYVTIESSNEDYAKVVTDDATPIRGVTYYQNSGPNAYTEMDPQPESFESDTDYWVKIADMGQLYLVETTTVNVPKSYSITDKMVDLAVSRGDCIALIDHLPISDRDFVGESSFYKVVSEYFADKYGNDFAAAFTPWVTVSTPTVDGAHTMPPSYGYLAALAKSIKTNANWIAVAGVTRGQIPNLLDVAVDKKLTNSIAETSFQNRNGVSINAITNIKPFGQRIWGNRTLRNNAGDAEDNLKATSFLNIRNLVSDVKKVAYVTCKKYMFEQNNDVLWTNFKASIEPTLEKMKTGAGISGYKIIKEQADAKAKLVASIKLYPIYAVEDFEITVRMEDDEVSVS